MSSTFRRATPRFRTPSLKLGEVQLTPIRLRDSAEWRAVRLRSASWLQPWEATSPAGSLQAPTTFADMVRELRREARAGRVVPWIIRVSGRLAGQLTVNSISFGSLRSAQAGYWVASEFAGRGVAPAALALATDHCWTTLGLHRMEVNIRPENQASRRVVDKLGFRCEGTRERYLHINGDWADHLSFALTVEEVSGGMTARWLDSRSADEAARSDESGN